MIKRIVLAALMLFVGGLASLTPEGLLLGLPLLLVGTHLAVGPYDPVGRLKQVSRTGIGS